MPATFLGAAIVDFNIKGGFGQEAALDVSMTECEYNNKRFAPPIIGSPVLFNFEGWEWYGIFDTYQEDRSSSGNPMYSVNVTNGHFILGGVELILSDYYGSTNYVPNLINVFGHMENSGYMGDSGNPLYSGNNVYKENPGSFGSGNINSAGMSWYDIATSIAGTGIYNSGVGVPSGIINQLTRTPYGGPITYKGYKYKLDLSNLPSIPRYYRINGDSINLLDFVSEVCSAGGHDYFVKLKKPTIAESGEGWNGTFEIATISRIEEPETGVIETFCSGNPCVVSKNLGLEVRKDAHSKFVVGANLERMFFNYPQDSGDNPLDIYTGVTKEQYQNDTVLPYFGEDVNGNAIVGYTPGGMSGEYLFDVDMSDIAHLTGSDSYTSSLAELRAASSSRGSWERFLSERNLNRYVIDPEGFSLYPFVSHVPSYVNGLRQDPITTLSGIPLYPIFKYGYNHLLNDFNPQAEISAVALTRADTEYITESERILYYPTSTVLNPYFQRATRFRIISGWEIPFARMFESDLYLRASGNPRLAPAYNAVKSNLGIDNIAENYLNTVQADFGSRAEDNKIGQFSQNVTDKIYKKIKDLADNYYNKKFMVSIPFTLAAMEPESTNIRMSQEIAENGFIDEAQWATAYDSGLLPNISGINILLSPENKLYPYVKYIDAADVQNYTVSSGAVLEYPYTQSLGRHVDEIVILDQSSPDQYFYSFSNSGVETIYVTSGSVTVEHNYHDLWVKCAVQDRIVFQDNQTLYGPRAVIELPNEVYEKKIDYHMLTKAMHTAFNTYARGAFPNVISGSGIGGGLFRDDPYVTDAELSKKMDSFGIDLTSMDDGHDILYADLYAIPLRSKLLSYGPWYAIGADGKVIYERTEDLNPWNYGGFDAMNQAGLAKVQDSITNQTFSEAGSVTLSGPPQINFGEVFTSGGPYVTDITCSFGTNGITTTYGFQAWSSHRSLSKLNGFLIDRNKQITNTLRQIKSNYREGLRNGRFKNAGDFYNKIGGRFMDLGEYTRKDRPSSSSNIIAGQSHGLGAKVVVQPIYNTNGQAVSDYENKAIMSLDGLYRPFSTIPHDILPSFESPEEIDSAAANSITLNPFQENHDIAILSYGSGIKPGDSGRLVRGDSGSSYIKESGEDFLNFRGMAHRIPMIGTGWGFATDGTPVPTGSGDGFPDDYATNSKNWKTGPIDLRWDNSRKVWSAGAETKIYLSKVTNTYNPMNFSYEVERSNSRDQFSRIGPTGMRMMAFNPSGTIYDPEYLAYSGNESNVGSYELLDYEGIQFPHYEAFIIRETSNNVGNEYYNIWSEDCQDCGHVSNPCPSGSGVTTGYHGGPSLRKKILIENPLKQGLDAGDLAFTVKTGRKKKVNTGTFINGSGSGAAAHISTNASGAATFVVDSGGSNYVYGGFGIVNGNICSSVSLIFTSGVLTSGTVSPLGGYPVSRTYSISIYPTNAEVGTESLDVHWILQAEFKSTQVNTYVGCDGGLLQTCSVKIQTQGFKSCEWCGEDTALINSF